MMEAADMVKWRLRLPYFLPHVWQAMLLTLFGVSGLVGAAGALYLLKLRGLW